MLSMPRIVRPDPHRFRGRNLVPPLDRPLADPLSETKNWRNLLTGRRGSQVSHSAKLTLPLRARRNHEHFRLRQQDNPQWHRECSASLLARFLLETNSREARGNSLRNLIESHSSTAKKWKKGVTEWWKVGKSGKKS